MGESLQSASAPEKAAEVRLESWKEIAAYLNRDVTTVQRWERREGMPVHRHVHDRRGSVYALRSELEAWSRSRSLPAGSEGDKAGGSPEAGAVARLRWRPALWTGAAARRDRSRHIIVSLARLDARICITRHRHRGRVQSYIRPT